VFVLPTALSLPLNSRKFVKILLSSMSSVVVELFVALNPISKPPTVVTLRCYYRSSNLVKIENPA
jgi:hypothetical protein